MPDTVHKKQGAVIYCPQNEHTRPRKNILSTHIVPTGTLYTPMGSGERMVERMLPVFDALYAFCRCNDPPLPRRHISSGPGGPGGKENVADIAPRRPQLLARGKALAGPAISTSPNILLPLTGGQISPRGFAGKLN